MTAPLLRNIVFAHTALGGMTATIGILPAPMTSKAKAEAGPAGCNGSAWVCTSPAIPKTQAAKKLSACMEGFFANRDVYKECFTEDFVGTAPDFGMSYEALGKPGYTHYKSFQKGALYDFWFWRDLTYVPTVILQQGDKWFLDTLWDGAGPKNASPGTPFCEHGNEMTCVGYFQPVEARVDHHKFHIWHLIETRGGKISRWTVNYDMLGTVAKTMKDMDVVKQSLGMTATMLRDPKAMEQMTQSGSN